MGIVVLETVCAAVSKHSEMQTVLYMNIVLERQNFMKCLECFACNQQEADILFSKDYSEKTPEEIVDILAEKIKQAQISRATVTVSAR